MEGIEKQELNEVELIIKEIRPMLDMARNATLGTNPIQRNDAAEIFRRLTTILRQLRDLEGKVGQQFKIKNVSIQEIKYLESDVLPKMIARIKEDEKTFHKTLPNDERNIARMREDIKRALEELQKI